LEAEVKASIALQPDNIESDSESIFSDELAFSRAKYEDILITNSPAFKIPSPAMSCSSGTPLLCGMDAAYVAMKKQKQAAKVSAFRLSN